MAGGRHMAIDDDLAEFISDAYDLFARHVLNGESNRVTLRQYVAREGLRLEGAHDNVGITIMQKPQDAQYTKAVHDSFNALVCLSPMTTHARLFIARNVFAMYEQELPPRLILYCTSRMLDPRDDITHSIFSHESALEFELARFMDAEKSALVNQKYLRQWRTAIQNKYGHEIALRTSTR